MKVISWRDSSSDLGLLVSRLRRQPRDSEANMGDFENRLAALEEENRRLRHALRVRGQRPSGRKIRPGTHHGNGRIFGYARASSEKPEDSVAMQEGLIRKKVEQLGGRFVRTFADESVSATDIPWPQRRGFMTLMARLRPGDHLIIWRLDRLDHCPVGTVAALERVVDRGVCLHVLDHGGMQLDLDEEAGRLLVVLLGHFAELMVTYRREAARQSICWRKDRGLAYNRLPELGKCRIPHSTPDRKRTGIAFDLWDSGECDVIREIWRRHELEGETLYAIAKDLKARDARRWDGRPWVPRGCQRQTGSGKRYPFNPRTVQRAFWKYVAMLAAGKDLQDLEPAPQNVQQAVRRLQEHRLRWTGKGQPGRVPQEIRELLERNDLKGLPELTPRSWAKRLYPGPGQ
jgi:DNA invertase Pin-like site-specific DNA recombinase